MISNTRYEQLEKLHDSGRTQVYRALDQSSGHPVVLKLLKPDMAGPHNLSRVWREYELLRELADLPVVRVLDCVEVDGSRMLVLEDSGGQTVAQWRAGEAVAPEDFLPLAIRWTSAVDALHRRDVLHKDLHPGNVLISPPDARFGEPGWELRLIDFDSAALRPRQEVELHPPNQINGSLPYLAPEQSGRINRVADHRADYYALGVSFYELLTGSLPFEANDTLGWLHCHLAVHPLPPDQVNHAVPEALSRIVMRLMAKSPEDRYQSGSGLLSDLELCRGCNAGRSVPADFVPGAEDLPGQLRLPQRLYGRESEIDRVIDAFTRCRTGGVQLMLIGGAPGSGKTSLVRHVINHEANAPGYLLQGKFDPLKRHVPYDGWVQAFNRLLRFWLSESPAQLERWRERILTGVGDGVGMLTAVLPNAAWLIGAEPQVQVAPEQAQRQFDHVLQRFVASVASADHPLVIFLDDLQWADAASTRLLLSLLENGELAHVLFVGTYRLGELVTDHPLMRAREAPATAHVRYTDVLLDGLEPRDVGLLVADALHTLPDRVGPLADLLYERSGGNPFELGLLLEDLAERGVVRFDAAARGWQWDAEQLAAFRDAGRQRGTPVVASLVGLSEDALRVLQLAACAGGRFSIEPLARALGQSPQQLELALSEALHGDLVVPVEGDYRFAHDRIHEAVYATLDEAARSDGHLRIGRALLTVRPQQDVFEVVHQLNRATAQLQDEVERHELAVLNLEAARKARAGVAYAEARIYATTCTRLLATDSWSRHAGLTFSAHLELAELHYLDGEFAQAEAVLGAMLAQPLQLLERAQALNLQVNLNTMRARYDEALAGGREALALLGVRLPEERVTLACEELIGAILRSLAELPDGALADMEDMQSTQERMAVRLLASLAPVTYFVDQALYPYVVALLTRFCMDHGPTRDTAFGYASFGLILASRKAFFSAYRFGEAAEVLAERFRDPGQQCKALQIVANHIKLWGAPLTQADALNQRVYRLGLESGELQFAGYGRNNHLLNNFYMGRSLQRLDERGESYHGFCSDSGNVIAADTVDAVRLPVRNLLGLSRDRQSFDDARYPDAEAFLANCEANRSHYAACSFWVHRGLVAYLYEEYAEAMRCLAQAEPLLAYMPGSIVAVQWHLFSGLAAAALADESGQLATAEVRAQRDALALLAEHAPENFHHAECLVAGELARQEGRMWDAVGAYDEAISSAEKHGFYHHQALANELAGRFWLKAGKSGQARVHLEAAHAGYRRWGALRKARDLRRRYLTLWLDGQVDAAALLNENDTGQLDWFALLKTSQAMAAEINMGRLMQTVMEAVIEHAGAERCLLLLRRDRHWWVEAEGGVGEPSLLADGVALDEFPAVAHAVVYYVARTGEDLVLGDASADTDAFGRDPYVRERQLRSVLCTPLTHKGQVLGALYLENGLVSHAFSAERLAVLKILAGQAAIALQNARLYGDLEERVRQRTEQLERLNARLEVLASTDHLTGVMNRRRVQEQMEVMLAQARRYGTPLAVILFDIDHFKGVNDQHGHGAGDQVLQEIARRTQAMLRDTDILARWGGEEFIVLTQHAELPEASALAERLRRAIADRPFAAVGRLTASFGVAWSSGGESVQDLVSAADTALYEAKDAGRNRVYSSEPSASG